MTQNTYLTVKQVASYLHLNEKKIYELVHDNLIPATKITGKWLFPRALVDRWLLESAHEGLLNDRLTIVGSDDPLFYRLILAYTARIGTQGLVCYAPNGTGLGLLQLQKRRADACCLHWGPQAESSLRHPALVQQHRDAGHWVLVHLYQREQGLIVHPDRLRASRELGTLLQQDLRWAMRQEGAGSQRYLLEILAQENHSPDQLNQVQTAYSEREAAALIAMGEADIAPGARAAAVEAGLGFISHGWESFDIALPRSIWFRNLFQGLLKEIQTSRSRQMLLDYQGYNPERCGELLWGGD
ncbi:MAG: helix-turn-helix transcriptional regulator [Thiothrix sp.]|nr:helix-turn-helix transcriptional regulator [Thiothrix sp.]